MFCKKMASSASARRLTAGSLTVAAALLAAGTITQLPEYGGIVDPLG